MSSSGLIYAVIVGAWAAYLVPMWLRRQDELNEARPTERFSTAIRLLSGRAAMERKAAARGQEDDSAEAAPRDGDERPATGQPRTGVPAAGRTPSGQVKTGPTATGQATAGQSATGQRAQHPRSTALPPVVGPQSAPLPVAAPVRERAAAASAARPVPESAPPSAAAPGQQARGGPQGQGQGQSHGQSQGAAGRRPDPRGRAALLARRRRMVILLFAAFTLGMIAAAVGGVALLWIPAVPAVLFSVYIAHLRRQERHRFEVKLDRRRAAEAAQQLRERERERRRAAAAPDTAVAPAAAPSPRPRDSTHPDGRTAAGSGVHHVQALVEAADSDDTDDSDESDGWGSGTRERATDAESWDPVPVPLPTYVTAPVAPRSTGGGLDLNAPDTWSAGRGTATPPPAPTPAPAPRAKRPPATPLFDQYADETPHPRAANE